MASVQNRQPVVRLLHGHTVDARLWTAICHVVADASGEKEIEDCSQITSRLALATVQTRSVRALLPLRLGPILLGGLCGRWPRVAWTVVGAVVLLLVGVVAIAVVHGDVQ